MIFATIAAVGLAVICRAHPEALNQLVLPGDKCGYGQDEYHDTPTADDLVRNDPAKLPGQEANWDTPPLPPEYKWRRFGDLPQDATFEVCIEDIPPGPVYGASSSCHRWAFAAKLNPEPPPGPIATITANWLPPTLREDNTPLAPGEVTGYQLFWSYSPRPSSCVTPLNSQDLSCYTASRSYAAPPAVLTVAVSANAVLYMAVAAIDTFGGISAYSNEIAVPVDVPTPARPNMPTEFSATVTVQ